MAAKTTTTKTIKPAQAAKPKLTPKANSPKACLCGCGEMTKGGSFRPGHDARYHAAQRKAGNPVTFKADAEKRAKAAAALKTQRANRMAARNARMDEIAVAMEADLAANPPQTPESVAVLEQAGVPTVAGPVVKVRKVTTRKARTA